MTEPKRGLRRTLEGQVIGDAMDKTIVVSVTNKVKHPLYGKYIKRSKKYYAHDENNEAKIGDWVRIVESRPLSRTKCWRMLEVTRAS